MVHIKIKKGLDIPIKGKPSGAVKAVVPGGEASVLAVPQQVALDLKPFDEVKFRLLVKVGDQVKVGQPLAEDKDFPGRYFVSPAGGTVHEIRRGAKRSLRDIVINVSRSNEEYEEFSPIGSGASRKEIIDLLLKGGAFTRIRARPFSLLANPEKPPRAIFVKAIESAPFVPPAELQVQGHEKEFQAGLDALAKLTDGKVHLVYRNDSTFRPFLEAKNVEKHTAEGPHPVANASVHIQQISPIRGGDDNVWVLNAHDAVGIGYLVSKGQTLVERVVSIAGPGVIEDRIGFFKVREGYPISALISGRIYKGQMRLISGDPLMGKKTESEDFLGFDHYAFCVIPEGSTREFLHFFGLGLNKYSFSKAYLSGHLDNRDREYNFTTNQHGEHRAFIDATLYDKVMPLPVPTMLLVKAVMAEDFELADSYGLLEVDSEDFALPTFVCPSKMEMTEIIRKGIRQFAKETLA